MGKIVLLDDLTINKIAAGEVIERPASVVKELVENSIDAGANNITVEIKNGGISYIRVTDNGKGFEKDDMEIAFERHATSKIRSADDLQTVKSMGFRGEALASIAAISRVELKSKTEDEDIGYKVIVEGGNIIEKEEEACIKGSTITIENLFFNTPVRYKFLKKDFTEAGYIEDVMTRIALINPNISIKLINSGKTIIQTSGDGDIKSVIYNIYGKEVVENILNVDYEYEDIKVTGVVGKPAIARSNRSNQIFFVNKRYIKDKTLTSSAEQAFKGMITIGKFGFLILNIEMNPEKVDVNVHPAKLEVRFEEESKVFKAVYHSIKDTLLKSDLVNDTQTEYENIETDNTHTGLFSRMFNKNNDEKFDSTNEDIGNVIAQVYNSRNNSDEIKMQETIENTQKIENIEEKNQIENINNTLEETKVINLSKVQEETKLNDNISSIKNENNSIDYSEIFNSRSSIEQGKLEEKEDQKHFGEMYSTIFGSEVKENSKLEEEQEKYTLEEMKEASSENVSMFEQVKELNKPVYKFIGIAFSTYIIIELDKELYLIDQHAAHERILYEKVKQNYYNNTGSESQLMLLPDIINLTHKEMDILKDNVEMFTRAGFIFEEFGENTIKLNGVPNICLELDTKELFLETLDEINTVARTAKQEIEERFISTVACKAAVKANMALSKEEVESLMDKLLMLPNPFTCPHGRPTAIKMTKIDLEKKFSRRL